eukprot:TRINITY_DN22006_c0_g1_i2.p2 TRINITY_DN22006_c0_g1~~TRINITY_DN22006_c0_g1_i2.p2  ORF type:complete len:294 (+),score=78.27 TRINITY_DN22006_c0_g1_i2:849-1730(+)
MLNSVITTSGKAQCWQVSRQQLRQGLERALLPVESAASVAAPVYAAERQSQWTTALVDLAEMLAASVEADELTLGIALNALAPRLPWASSLQAVEELMLRPRGGDTTDERSSSVLLATCERELLWQAALEVVASDGQTRRLRCDAVGWSSATSACGKESHWLETLWLLQATRDGGTVVPSVMACGAAITALQDGLCWTAALTAFQDMQASLVDRSPTAFGAAVTACQKAGAWTEALGLLHSAAAVRLVADAVAIADALGACRDGASWTSAPGLLEEAAGRGLQDVRQQLYMRP